MADSRRREKKGGFNRHSSKSKKEARESTALAKTQGLRSFAAPRMTTCASLRVRLKLNPNPHPENPRVRHPVPLLRGAGKEVAGDDGALNFAGAFVDGDDAGVTVHAFDVRLAGIAETAVDLHGLVDNAIDHFAGVEFGAGGGGRRGGKGSRGSGGGGRKEIFAEGGLVEEGAGGFDFGMHVGKHPLDGLEFTDGLAKGFAGASVFDGFIERALGKADGLRGDADASTIERGERDAQALAFFTEAIGRGNSAIVEDELDRRRRALAHLVFVATDFETGGVGFEKESANSLPARGGIGFREDDEETCGGAIGDPGFGAVEDIGG